jgi:hypothetical protein
MPYGKLTRLLNPPHLHFLSPGQKETQNWILAGERVGKKIDPRLAAFMGEAVRIYVQRL